MHNVLFYRDFRNFTGGHLKVWDYFNHVNAAPDYRAGIYFTPESLWDVTNPWLAIRDRALTAWSPHETDVVFLGGFDWLQLPASERPLFECPVINLIQHVHHGDPAHPLSTFLTHRAIRVCVSEEVQSAIQATGRVNGPTVVIPNGVELLSDSRVSRSVDWLICGVKEGQSAIARDLAHRIAAAFPSDRVRLLTKLVPRAEFLDALGQGRRAVLLPRATEGFYLPALEAMALGTLVICPDCIGNRSFCRDADTAVLPAGDLFEAVCRARSLPAGAEAAILANAHAIAAKHSLANERVAFHHLLARIPSLW